MKTLVKGIRYGALFAALAAFSGFVQTGQAASISVSGGDDGLGSVTRSNDQGECKKDVNYNQVGINITAGPGETVACVPPEGVGYSFPVGTTSVKCTATDANGFTADAYFSVTIQDTEDPDLNVAANQRNNDFGQCSAVVNYLDQSIDDNCKPTGVGCSNGSGPCAPPSFTCDPPSGSTFAVGIHTVNCTGTDASGNEVPNSFQVTVLDTEAPTISNPYFLILAPTNGCAGNVPFDVAAQDNCDPNPSIECILDGTTPVSSGDVISVGQHVIRCAATDNTGHGGFDHPESRNEFEVLVVAPLGNIIWHQPLVSSSCPGPGASHEDVPGIHKFKAGSLIPIQVAVRDCPSSLCNSGPDVTSQVNGYVVMQLIDQITGEVVSELPEDTTSIGDPSSGLMSHINGHLKYNLKTTGYPAGTVGDPTLQYRLTINIERISNSGITVYSESMFLETK